MAVTVGKLAVVLRIQTDPEAEVTEPHGTVLEDLLTWAQQECDARAPGASPAARDQAIYGLCGYVYDAPSSRRGEAYANAWRNSGADTILRRWVVRRAVVLPGDGTELPSAPVGPPATGPGGAGVDQTARDAAEAAQGTADAAQTAATAAQATADQAQTTASAAGMEAALARRESSQAAQDAGAAKLAADMAATDASAAKRKTESNEAAISENRRAIADLPTDADVDNARAVTWARQGNDDEVPTIKVPARWWQTIGTPLFTNDAAANGRVALQQRPAYGGSVLASLADVAKAGDYAIVRGQIVKSSGAVAVFAIFVIQVANNVKSAHQLFFYDGSGGGGTVGRTDTELEAFIERIVSAWAVQGNADGIPGGKTFDGLFKSEAQEGIAGANVEVSFDVGLNDGDEVDETDAAATTWALSREQAAESGAFLRVNYTLTRTTLEGKAPFDIELLLQFANTGATISKHNIKDEGSGSAQFALGAGAGSRRWAVRVVTAGRYVGKVAITGATYHSAAPLADAPMRHVAAAEVTVEAEKRQEQDALLRSEVARVEAIKAIVNGMPPATASVKKAVTFNASGRIWEQTEADAFQVPGTGFVQFIVGNFGASGIVPVEYCVSRQEILYAVNNDEIGLEFTAGRKAKLYARRNQKLSPLAADAYSTTQGFVMLTWAPARADEAATKDTIQDLIDRVAALEADGGGGGGAFTFTYLGHVTSNSAAAGNARPTGVLANPAPAGWKLDGAKRFVPITAAHAAKVVGYRVTIGNENDTRPNALPADGRKFVLWTEKEFETRRLVVNEGGTKYVAFEIYKWAALGSNYFAAYKPPSGDEAPARRTYVEAITV